LSIRRRLVVISTRVAPRCHDRRASELNLPAVAC
jgi:hypothetical protein